MRFDSGAAANKCAKTNCVEGKYTVANTCTECLEGFVLNQNGLCTQTCLDSNFEPDYNGKVCRKKCLSTQYKHPTNPNLCIDCSTLLVPVTGRCTSCDYTDGIVGRFPVLCKDCVSALTINSSQQC